MIFRLRRKRPIIRPKIEQGGRFLHSAVLNISLKPLAVLQVLSGGFRFVCLAEYQKSPRPWGCVLDFSTVRRRAACGAFFRLTKKIYSQNRADAFCDRLHKITKSRTLPYRKHCLVRDIFFSLFVKIVSSNDYRCRKPKTALFVVQDEIST